MINRGVQTQEKVKFPKNSGHFECRQNPQAFNLQFLMIVIQQRVPLVLLKQTKADALNL